MTEEARPSAVVTGAAAGVGREVARRLVDLGWTTIAVDRDEDGLSSLTDQLERIDGGGDIRPVTGDLADPGSVLAHIEETASDLDRLDGLANVAGVSEPLGRKQADPATFDRILRINLTAPYTLAVGLWPLLSGGGRIVNVGSMTSFAPIPDTLGYASSKAGLNGLTMSLNAEGAADGISARCICLGWVDTGMARNELAPSDAKMSTGQAAIEVVRVLAGGETPRGAIVYPTAAVDCGPAATADGRQRRRRSSRSMSRFASFFAMSCRLSAFLRPSATPTSNFARPSLK